MKFRVKDMDIATGGILIVILNEKDAKKMDLHSGDRILVKHNKKTLTCILDISESKKAVPEGKIGLFEEVLNRLNVRDGTNVEVAFTGKPESLKHIRDKLFGKKLTYQELYHIMDDITNDRLTDIEKTYFVAGGFTNGWNAEEIVEMTKAMVKTGKTLKFGRITLDKHCI
ncbi:MAG: thymidine phosphorylase, partial [Nanoarchaeota archaeon]|nr:thymidine phosphorylase [Nanoarchaeota archaeon]